MSMQAAGFPCPLCGFDKTVDILQLLKNKNNQPIGVDLQCTKCQYTWQKIYRK